MKYAFLGLSMSLLLACTSINPYYKQHLPDLPYRIFFEEEQQTLKYKILGENNVSNNIFKCTLPDSLGGVSNTGDCVVELLINNATSSIKEVNIVGMTIYNKQTNTVNGYDRYNQNSKTVKTELYNGFDKYLPFIRNTCEKLRVDKVDVANGSVQKVYCKLLFGV